MKVYIIQSVSWSATLRNADSGFGICQESRVGGKHNDTATWSNLKALDFVESTKIILIHRINED